MNEDSGGGGDFIEQLSSLIFKKLFFKSKFVLLEHGDVASSKYKEFGCGWLKNVPN